MPFTETQKFQRRIERKVRKKNEKIKANYPLFFDQFKTTYEREEENTIEKQSWSCERLFEGLDYFNWNTWFKIEIYKRALMKARRRDLIFKSYRRFFKAGVGNEFLADVLCQELIKITDHSPRLVSNFIEKNKNQVFGDLIQSASIYPPTD